ncbi:hypothetical protein EC917_112163 [Bacillus thuringiensis]|uniref:Uncharacterized protein n=1 Tax=Bacillus thuringiensis TaxID=1428 RepID=A0A4R4BDD2_BACTU|nr:hypothetical protein [Bacillus thuringiensis]TCW53040.1 hypothetical protein EC917_112163 [Bacillus thuringiensis]TCW53210.1 hypothetical protein EC910_112163 [Bacillus thuringiensis]
MRVYQLDSTQLQHTLTPTNMCNGVLQYYQYKQYTVVSVLDLSKHDSEMATLLLACLAEALIHSNPDSFLAKDKSTLLYWCRKNHKGFHSISDDGFLRDFKQVYECHQALQNVGKPEKNIKINM